MPHSDNLVPVDSGLLSERNVSVFDEAPKLVSGHSQSDAVRVGSKADTHSVPVNFKPVELVDPDSTSACGHSASLPSLVSPAEGNTLAGDQGLNVSLRVCA